MKETGGNYRDAELAYERAKDWENVIRVNLEKMDNYDKAVKKIPNLKKNFKKTVLKNFS